MRARAAAVAALAVLAVAVVVPSAAPAAIRTIEPGVRVSVAATGVPNATNVTFGPGRTMWVTSGAGGPSSSDGLYRVAPGSRRARRVVRTAGPALGVAYRRGRLYVSSFPSPSCGRIAAYTAPPSGRPRALRTVRGCIPIGRHAVNSIAPGPDGRLYVGIGSKGDTRAGGGLSSTIASFSPGGRRLRVEARGLRNPFGLAFVPGTSALLVSDNGRDDLGPRRPPEELNAFDVRGRVPDFGFPGGGRGTTGSIVDLPAHAAPGGVAVSRSWRGSGLTAFVAQYGSSFRPPTGSDVWRVRLERDGSSVRATSARRWATGFRRFDPLGAAIGPDGALYVTLLGSGRVVRFA